MTTGHRPIAVDSFAGQLPFRHGFPQYSIKWHLLATRCAFSRAHIDAAKFASWLHALRGAKVWCVMQGDMPEVALSDIKYGEHEWKCFLLEEGDYL